ncbi:MAG: hypothetical protein GKS03_09330 [Alphaproteobacteria bacterium]|nr:hypothetical protein [Alphaproteobacteria bacterium]
MESKIKSALRWSVFVLAVAVTTGWLVLCFAYLTRLGWDGLMSLEPGALAATLAAAAGPPVALWLILVVTAQRQELADLRRAVLDFGLAMRRGQDHAETHGRALLEVSAASRRQAAQDGLVVALDDLASHASVVAERLGVLDVDGLARAWERYGAGDGWALLRPFLDRAAAEKDFGSRLAEALKGDAVSQLAAGAFMRRLDLMRGDGTANEQRLIREILEDGPVAQVGRLFANDVAAAEDAFVAVDRVDQPEAGGDQAASIEDRLGPQPTLFQPESKTA